MRQYLHNIYSGIWTALVGMKITMREFFTPAVTNEYPERRPEIAERFRGRLHNNIEDCVVCFACARECPVDCIYIDAEDAPKGMFYATASTGAPIRRNALRFDIDMSLCCYCGLCTEVCPTECLVMTTDFEYATYDRTELIYHFAKPWTEAKPMPKKKTERRGGGERKARAAGERKAAREGKAPRERKAAPRKPRPKKSEEAAESAETPPTEAPNEGAE